MARRPRIAVAIGDPNGIGPEIALKAALAAQGEGFAEPVVVGDIDVIEHYFQRTGEPLLEVETHDVAALPPGVFAPGQVSAAAGAASVAYAREAIGLVASGGAEAVLAAPHNERAVRAANIAFTGYPSLLAEATGTAPDRVFLMLVGGGLRICHATLHQSLRSVTEELDVGRVAAAIRAAHAACRLFGIAKPSIGVAGLNPHAGEGGLFGDEDEGLIAPSVTAARDAGIDVQGPTGADLLFSERRHDAYVAMFHDQGHIAVKVAAGPRRALALSIGTPVLFASVGHGSAHDIAGRGEADAEPMTEALRALAGLLGRSGD